MKMAARHVRRPGDSQLAKPKRKADMKQASKPQAQGRPKRKAEAPPTQAPAPASGDVDDFMGMLDDLEDYRGPAASGGESDLDGDQAQAGGGGGEAGGSGGEGADDAAGAGGKAAKKRRKSKASKLSALEFEARRELVKQIDCCSAEEQADWLWASYQQHAAASALERGGLTAAGLAPLPAHGSLEARLKALQPGSWQAEFCGGKAGSGQRPPGSPSLLLVSASAIGAVRLIKLCPGFHRACRIGKLFAKHLKVAEQEEALRSQVVCVAAGTPNRLCKLADGGSLRLDRVKHVVLDLQLDAKQRDILAIPETRADWWQFYTRHLAAPLEAGSLQLSLVNSDHVGGAAA